MIMDSQTQSTKRGIRLLKKSSKTSRKEREVTSLHALHATRSSHEKPVCLSVCLSNASLVTKRNKVVPAFLYHVKERLS